MPGLAPDRRAFRKAERKRLVTLPLPWFVQSRCPALADMIGGHRVRTALMISSDGSLGGGSRWCRGWHGRAGAETMFSGTLSRASSSACAWRSLCGATLRLTPASAARRQNSPRAAAPETVARAWAVDDGDSGPTGGSAGPSATAVAAPSATRRCRPRAGAGRCTFNATTASTLRRRAIPRPASSRAARSGDDRGRRRRDDALRRGSSHRQAATRARARTAQEVRRHPLRREEGAGAARGSAAQNTSRPSTASRRQACADRLDRGSQAGSRSGRNGSLSGGWPCSIWRPRSISAFISAPSRITTLVIHSHMRKMITAARLP